MRNASTVSNSYEEYLKEHKDGINASTAHQKIALLEEAKEWKLVAASNSPNLFEAFLRKFPNGPHSSDAQNFIKKLLTVDTDAWKAAERVNTIDGYGNYIKLQQYGSHVSDATKRIVELQTRVAEIKSTAPEIKPTATVRSKDVEVSNLFFPKASFANFEKGKLSDTIDFKSAQPVRRLILSNDLSRLYTGGDDGALRVWDLNSISNSIVLQPRHSNKIYSLARSANSKYLATASWDRSVFLWDTHANERTAAITVRPQVFSMTFSPTGRWIAAAGTDGQVDFINTLRMQVVNRRHTTPKARIHAIAYIPNKSEDLVLGDGKGALRLWSIRKGQEKYISNAHKLEILALTVDPTGATIASAGIDKKIKLWDTKLKFLSEIPDAHARYITALRFMPEHEYLASGGGDYVVRIWDTRTGKKVFGPFAGHKGDVEEIEFSPDGKYMFTSSEDKTIKIWDVDNGNVLYTFVAFSDGNYVVYDDKQRYLSSKDIEFATEPAEATLICQCRLFEHILLFPFFPGRSRVVWKLCYYSLFSHYLQFPALLQAGPPNKLTAS